MGKLFANNLCPNFKDLLNITASFAPGFGLLLYFVFIFSISELEICAVNTRIFCEHISKLNWILSAMGCTTYHCNTFDLIYKHTRISYRKCQCVSMAKWFFAKYYPIIKISKINFLCVIWICYVQCVRDINCKYRWCDFC